jgi:hypothetical protein
VLRLAQDDYFLQDIRHLAKIPHLAQENKIGKIDDLARSCAR